jgi:hypothetical protein
MARRNGAAGKPVVAATGMVVAAAVTPLLSVVERAFAL